MSKENTIKNDNIKTTALEKIALVLLVIFTLNPLVKVLFQIDISKFHFMYGHNRYVLAIGAIILGIYIMKQQPEGQPIRVKTFFKTHIPVALFLVFGMLMIITTLLNGAPEIAIIGSYYRGEGLLGFLSYIIYFLLAVFVISEKSKKIFINIFLGTSVPVGLLIFVDYIILNDRYGYAMKDYMIFYQYNHLGYYLLMAIITFGMMFITCKKTWQRIIYLCGFMFMTAVLIMNDTWGCQIALLVGIIFTVIVYSIGKGRFRPVTLILLVAMLTTYLISYIADDRLRANIEKNIEQQFYDTGALLDKDEIDHMTTGVARIVLWENALKYLGESPLIGHGADVTGSRLKGETGDNDRCHCEFLNYAVSFGVPTALVYIVAVFTVYLRGLKKKKYLTEMHYVGLCVAFTYLASSLIGNSMFYTAPYLFIALGFGYVKNEGNE